MNLFDRVYGCLAGLALGDCLGMPTEFLTPEQIRKEFSWVDRFVQAPAYHPHKVLRPGQITDDTGQALAIAHAYRSDGQLLAEDVARELLIWAEKAGEQLPLIIGPSTRNALDKLRAGGDPSKTGLDGKTNGAAYRAIIVGLVNYNRPERLLDQVIQACLPTHGTSIAISGGAAVAFSIGKALSDGLIFEELFSAAKQGAVEGRHFGKWVWGTPLEGRIDLAVQIARQKQPPEILLFDLYRYIGVDMLVAESVATAFGLVALANGDPMKAVTYGANIGGDTDTIAGLAGAICGAWRGITSMDSSLLAEIERINHIELRAEASHIVALADYKE
jgi:ADP-ribosylglycohydrolase